LAFGEDIMPRELRQAERYDVDVAAEVYTRDAVLPAKTRNLSETGVCLDLTLELTEQIETGVSLFLVTDGIEDPDAEPLNIKAKVIWCSQRDDGGFSAGLRFSDLSVEGQTAIKGFLLQLQNR
jgi:c-di-GMP-binding flagellar brake protein YcgR